MTDKNETDLNPPKDDKEVAAMLALPDLLRQLKMLPALDGSLRIPDKGLSIGIPAPMMKSFRDVALVGSGSETLCSTLAWVKMRIPHMKPYHTVSFFYEDNGVKGIKACIQVTNGITQAAITRAMLGKS